MEPRKKGDRELRASGRGRGRGAGRSPAGLGRRRGRAGAQCWPSPGRGPADSASGQEVTQKTVRDVEKRGPRWVRNPGRPAQIRAPRLSLLGWGRGRSWGWRTSRGIGRRGRSGRPRRDWAAKQPCLPGGLAPRPLTALPCLLRPRTRCGSSSPMWSASSAWG